MRWGTSHFVSREAACRYYAAQGYTETDVSLLIADGSIKIGKPPLKPGQRLSIIRGEGRYQIEDSRP